jgi:hypothetical protein
MLDHPTPPYSKHDVLENLQQDLDAFEQRERQFLADERRERAQRLNARFALSGLDLSIGE